MANAMYPTARQKFAEAGIDWAGDDIKVVLLDENYIYSEAHEFLDDLTGTIDTSDNLASKTNVLGVLDAADLLITTVAGADIASFVIYQDTGSAASSSLLFYFDTNASSVAVDLTPDGGGVVIRWSNGTNKIARI